jgi:hypothetical protein
MTNNPKHEVTSMSSFCRVSLMRHVTILTVVAAFATAFASAQFAPSPNPSASVSASPTESSSSSLDLPDPSADGAAAMPAAPTATPARAGQNGGYDQNGGYQSHSRFSHLTFEAGGGANGPTSYSSSYITWGGNFTVGAGYHFSQRLSTLLEYQFIDDKLPGAIIAEAGSDGGHAHIWSLTLDPVFDLFPKSSNDLYITGGGGFYRKVTSFTILSPTQFCTYFYCGVGYVPTVAGHFSSNQGGWNVGGGYQHRMGGMYGESKVKLFAEVRYLDVLSPALTTSPNGLGTTTVGADTKLVPITLGVRW